jgi:hypothetical protein
MSRTCVSLSFVMGAAMVAGACGSSQPQAAGQAVTEKASPARAAAEAFVTTVGEADRSRTVYAFDAAERHTFQYIPVVRGGLPLQDMSGAQKAHVETLLRGALSSDGYEKTQQIIEHETILRELEMSRGVKGYERRDPGHYYLAVFGQPADGTPWGWRFEGHHLSVNVTHAADDDQRTVVAPLFFGANPARVPSGPHEGLRLLALEEDLGRELVTSLDTAQRTTAVIAPETTNDIVTTTVPKVDGLTYAGLQARDMTDRQRAQLRKLIETYAARLTLREARDQLARIDAAGFDSLYFAWAGGLESGQKHYYRVHGPTVLIEYDNSQNDGNHIHTVWRDLERDFGGDLLRKHYALVAH